MKKAFLILALFLFLMSCFFLQKTQAKTYKEVLNAGISLTYLPEKPINNPGDPELAPEMTINSFVQSEADADALYYTWSFWGSSEKNDPQDWSQIVKSDLPEGVSAMEGYGVTELKFKLSFDDDKWNFIRIKLEVKETTQMNDENTGFNDIVIPLISSSNKISVFPVSAEINGNNEVSISLKSEEACTKSPSEYDCYLSVGDIIGLKVDTDKEDLTHFSWTIDGDPLTYSVCPLENSEGCEDSNIAFFPVLKSQGETYEVKVSAIQEDTNQKITFSRTFQVSEPSAFIQSTDTATCNGIIEGNWINLDGEATPAHSQNHFEAVAGSNIHLSPNFPVQDINNVYWTVDIAKFNQQTARQYGLVSGGHEYTAEIKDDGSISFPADTQVGYSFNVTFSALYTPDRGTKKALNKYWGVGINEFYEKQVKSTVNITIVEQLESDTSTGASLPEDKKNKTLATLASNAPAYFIFTIKIVLISALLLFSVYFLFSLFPKKNDE